MSLTFKFPLRFHKIRETLNHFCSLTVFRGMKVKEEQSLTLLLHPSLKRRDADEDCDVIYWTVTMELLPRNEPSPTKGWIHPFIQRSARGGGGEASLLDRAAGERRSELHSHCELTQLLLMKLYTLLFLLLLLFLHWSVVWTGRQSHEANTCWQCGGMTSTCCSVSHCFPTGCATNTCRTRSLRSRETTAGAKKLQQHEAQTCGLQSERERGRRCGGEKAGREEGGGGEKPVSNSDGWFVGNSCLPCSSRPALLCRRESTACISGRLTNSFLLKASHHLWKLSSHPHKHKTHPNILYKYGNTYKYSPTDFAFVLCRMPAPTVCLHVKQAAQ